MWANLCILYIMLAAVRSEYKWDTKSFKVPLDHFGFQRPETFEIKYLVNDDYWDRDKGPIFFYTGNEGQIEQFAKHTGLIWESAQEFNAKIVFAEHSRHPGQAGDRKANILAPVTLQPLTGLWHLTTPFGIRLYRRRSVYKASFAGRQDAVAGSYGGMLSAYFRMKYPHLVTGAIAASAPIHMYPGMSPCGAYYRIVTSSFGLDGGPKCVDNIRRSWSIIRNFSTNTNNTEWLRKNWNLCDPVKNATDVQQLVDFLQSMYETLAMVNYPFPSDFLVPLPAYPVRVVCQYLNDKLNDTKILEGIGKMLDTFTNYDKKSKCVDYKKGSDYGNLDASGWYYQACTEMVMPMCTDGTNDMFEAKSWNFTEYSADCYKKFSVSPNTDAARIQYGGDRLQAASNIIFSNGLKDPWAGGGVFNTVNESVEVVLIPDAAHHLDLMPSNPADPDTVKTARLIHKERIRRWIRQFRK